MTDQDNVKAYRSSSELIAKYVLIPVVTASLPPRIRRDIGIHAH